MSAAFWLRSMMWELIWDALSAQLDDETKAKIEDSPAYYDLDVSSSARGDLAIFLRKALEDET